MNTSNSMDNENTQNEGSDRIPDVITRYRPDLVIEAHQTNNQFKFVCANDVTLIITAVTERIFRCRYSYDGEFMPDFSYALNPDFNPETPEIYFEEFDDYYAIATYEVTCQIMKDRMLVNFFDKNGEAVCEDDDGFYVRESLLQGISSVKITKKAPEGKAFFGLGDKAGKLNMRGRAYENWCTDAFGFVESDDTLYRAIPFYYGLYENLGYGIFMDNTFKTRFSFDRKGNEISSFSANGGEVNYYFIAGPELIDVTKQYMQLTGKPELPPLWALGFHQCKWSYYPESVVREVAEEFRKRKIPCDSIYLDIDYMNEFRCFTWNDEAFPNPVQLVKDLQKDGFQTVVMIDPGIKVDKDYWVNQQGIEENHFCKREDGRLMKGPVWPSECHFPDYTNPTVRKWWGGLYEELVNEVGVNGFWNDMNEPALFKISDKTFPLSVRHNYDGHNCSHKKAHNIYGMQMSRASLDGIKKLRPEKRPFLLTRATFSGGQRFAAAWTGDNLATWEHLHLANIQSQRMSISGFSFIGSDIGGFAENPTGELFVRWLQLGVFHPLMRVHTMGAHLDGGAPIDPVEVKKMVESGEVQDQEPWSFGDEYTPYAKEAIELRYQLLPYLYTAFQKYVQDGTPILQPLSFFDQNNRVAIDNEENFVFGNSILVSPVETPQMQAKEVYLPQSHWYYYWTNEFYEGQQTVSVSTPLSQIPFFVKAGTVLPIAPIMQYSNEKPIGTLDLNIYYKKGKEVSELYQDSGDGYDYQNNNYRLASFELIGNEEKTIIQQTIEGDFEASFDKYLLNLIGFSSNKTITVDGISMEFEDDQVEIAANFKEILIH